MNEPPEAAAFLAAIVASTDDAIVGKDLESRVVSWNAGAERLFGYSAAEMLGQPITRIAAPDRLEEEPRIISEVKQGSTRRYETVRIRKDGTRIEVSLTVSPIRNETGQIIGVSTISRDLSAVQRAAQEASESRARLAATIESAMDAIISVDAGQRITLFNTAAEKMFGYSASEILGHPLDRLLPAQLRQAHRQHVEGFSQTGVTTRSMGHWRPLTALRSDGREFPIEASISHIEVGGHQILTAIIRDITERVQAQQRIEQMNYELEQRVTARTAELTAANKELEAFTYSVAHDLRAPLRHIDSFSRILAEEHAGALPPDAKRLIESIRSGSRHLSQLVDDLLNLARVGRQPLVNRATPLEPLVREVIANLRREAQGRAIAWRIQPLPTVQCDPGLMKQVFTNLLSNAIKYTRPQPSAVIEIGATQDRGQTAIYVRDNGVGFDMKYADKLFGVFQRLHRSDEFEGTGVGLATVERIIRKHRGHVWATGEAGKGAVFYFTVMPEKGPGAGP